MAAAATVADGQSPASSPSVVRKGIVKIEDLKVGVCMHYRVEGREIQAIQETQKKILQLSMCVCSGEKEKKKEMKNSWLYFQTFCELVFQY